MQDQYLKLKFFLVIIFILFFTLSIRKKLLGLKVKVNKPFPCMSTYLLVCHLVKTVTVTLCLCLVAQSCPTLCDPMDYIAHQAPLSMGFLRQDFGVGSHSLLQEIFPTQRSNPGLLQCRQILYPLSHQRSPTITLKGSI